MPSVVQTVVDPLQTLFFQAAAKVPSVLGALGILLLGSFLGRWLCAGFERMMSLTMVDDYSEKIGINDFLMRLGLGRSMTAVVGFLIYWLIFLAFLLSAANVLQLTIVSEFLQQVVLFMPKLIAAVLVLGGGLFLGHFAGGIVGRAAAANQIKGAGVLSQATSGILIIFSGIMALERLGIDTRVLAQSMQIIIGSVGLGFAIAAGIAFGHAGKDLAGQWLAELVRKDR